MAGNPPGKSAPPQQPSAGLRIARPFGIPVYVSPYWFVVAGLFVVFYARSFADSHIQGTMRYVVAAAFVVLLYASVLVHELSHSVVARGFDLVVRRILLYPLGGFSEIETEPQTPAREFLVSAAGPAMSLALAIAGYALYRLVHAGPVATVLLRQFWVANLLVAGFNLLPGLPLDGGRMLRAGAWKVTGKPLVATVVAAWAGRLLAVAILLVPLGLLADTGNQVQLFDLIWLAMIAAFMWVGASQSLRLTRVRERLPALQARTLARRAIPVPASLPLSEAIRRADAATARALVVVDGEDRPIAIVNEAAVMATPEQRRPWIDTGSLARTLDPSLILPADLSGMALLDAVRRSPATEYLLVEPSGQVFGVLAASDLDHAFAGV
ncbi:MAG TPA: site-2 protease family protein [Streptosporangiaceae bacterium]|nr:site-2 protease family protein [Streptosporangiaceae bacterium]